MIARAKATREAKPPVKGGAARPQEGGKGSRPRGKGSPAAGEPKNPRQIPVLSIREERGQDNIRLDEQPVGVISQSGSDQLTFWVWKGYRAGTSPSREEAIESAVGVAWSLVEWCRRNWAWSRETFGLGSRSKGIVEHIRKELLEVEQDPFDLEEWVDLMILSMDGFQRHGGTPQGLIEALDRKQIKNFARAWPDWRTMSDDVAIEHDRSKEKSNAK